jgi:hypothetical protein
MDLVILLFGSRRRAASVRPTAILLAPDVFRVIGLEDSDGRFHIGVDVLGRGNMNRDAVREDFLTPKPITATSTCG